MSGRLLTAFDNEDKSLANVQALLDDLSSWKAAPAKVKAAFAKQMVGKQYGYDPLFNAWIWFYTGWVTFHQSPTPEPDEDGPGEEDGPWAEGWAERAGLSPTPGQDGLEWLPMETAPKDGKKFVALRVMIVDEFDDAYSRDVPVRKNVEMVEPVIMQWVQMAKFIDGQFMEIPYKIYKNQFRYIGWFPLPPSPTSTGERE